MPKIVGMGHFLPHRRVDNRELEKDLCLSAAEIERQTGVRSRCYADEGVGPSDLACEAAKIALDEAGLTSRDVEFVVFATMTPDVTFPGAGCYLQDKLGCGTVGALDLRAQCCGFLFALEVAEQFVGAGKYRRILVAAAEVHSSGLDFSPSGAQVTPLLRRRRGYGSTRRRGRWADRFRNPHRRDPVRAVLVRVSHEPAAARSLSSLGSRRSESTIRASRPKQCAATDWLTFARR